MRRTEAKWAHGWIGAVAALGLAACSVLPLGERGDASPEVGPSLPFEMEVTPRVEASGQAILEVRMTLPTEMAQRARSSGSAARIRWTVDVLARPSGEQIHESSWAQTINESDSFGVVERPFEVPPGDFLVVTTAEEEATGISTTVRRWVSVPARDGAPTVLGTRLEVFHSEALWEAQVSHTVSVDLDSLRIRAQVLNAQGQTAQFMVERLTVDSTVAEPPTGSSLPPGSLRWTGVRLGEALPDIVFVSKHALASDLAAFVAPLPRLRTGTYRLCLAVEGTAEHRFHIVRRVGFPEVSRVGDLVAAMRYITTDSEMRALTARLDPFLQRRAFDRFWGDRIPDRRLAASTVRAYAERVEEANRRYSNQKEGWKTDRGMAHIVFGPPQRIDRTAETERWIYTSGPVSGLALQFEVGTERPEGWPFEVWVLQRGPAYDVAWQRARRAWRRGDPP